MKHLSPRGAWVIAHRGVSGRFPENTMAAFVASEGIGADLIEIDVHLSADGAVIVMHDHKLGRTCTGSGDLADLSSEYILAQDAGSWMSDQFAGERVPTLDQLLAGCALPIMCEIKPEGREIVEATAASVGKADAADRVVLASFSDANLAWAAEILPECERLALGTPDTDRNAHILAPQYKHVGKAQVEAAHDNGQALWAWTPDEPRDISAMINLGVDGIISNWPERTIEALEARP